MIIPYKYINNIIHIAVLPTAVSGSLQHYRQGTMVANIAKPLALGCMLG